MQWNRWLQNSLDTSSLSGRRRGFAGCGGVPPRRGVAGGVVGVPAGREEGVGWEERQDGDDDLGQGCTAVVAGSPWGVMDLLSYGGDYLSPAGLKTWGDGRLMIVGTEATLEVRTNVDVAGRRGKEHLIVTDGAGVRRIGCRRLPGPGAGRAAWLG